MTKGSAVIDRAPPPGDTGGGGGWAWLVTAHGVIEAELVRGLLEASGIVPVALDRRDPSPSAWLFPFGDQNALVRVFVLASQLESARLALLESGLALPEAAEPARREDPVRGWSWVAVALLVLAALIIATIRASVI